MRELISCGHLRIADLGLHKNRGMELTYITKGRMEWVVDGRVELVQKGDVFFTLPWQLHGSPVLRQPENEAWHLLFRLPGGYRKPRERFRFPRVLGFSPEQERTLSRTFSRAERHAWAANPRIKRIFPWMVRELEQADTLSRANGRNLLATLLVELSRENAAEPKPSMGTTESERRVCLLLQRLKEDCGEEWTLERMVRSCGVRRSRFNTLVQQTTGLSPMSHLTQLRVDRAKELLRLGGRSVTDIAMDCGFSSSQYFANVFRKCTGLSPSDYRRRFPEMYELGIDADAVPWRTIEEERERVRAFREMRSAGRRRGPGR